MFKLEEFDVEKFDSILSRGLSNGLGKAGESVCIEAAICETLGLGHSDDPKCVSEAVRAFKIKLNDSSWSSPQARAKGLRDLGIAQLGSKGVVDDELFAQRIAERTIRVLIPAIFREVFPNDKALLHAADVCEKDGTYDSVVIARDAAYAAAYAAAYDAADAANAATYAADAANAATYAAAAAALAATYADAAAYAATYAANGDKYLNLSAQLALEILKEMESPGVTLL